LKKNQGCGQPIHWTIEKEGEDDFRFNVGQAPAEDVLLPGGVGDFVCKLDASLAVEALQSNVDVANDYEPLPENIPNNNNAEKPELTTEQ